MNDEQYIDELDNNEDGVNLKEIKRYYKSLLAITLIVAFLGLIYAYFSTSIYQSNILVKITEDRQSTNNDFMTMAMGMSGNNVEDEINVFKSHNLARKALLNLNIGTRYFTTKSLKRVELYKDSPFVVVHEYLSPAATKIQMHLIPAKEGYFRLIIEPTLKKKIITAIRSFIAPLPTDKQPIVYDKLHKFGEKIETSWFTVTVQQVHELKNNEYFFTVRPNRFMTKYIAKRLSVTTSSKTSEIINLAFQDNVPLRAKEILQELTDSYIRENMKIKSESADRKLHFIDIQLEAINSTLENSAKNLEKYKATHIVVDLSSKAQLTAGKLSELETQLYDINTNIDVMESILNYIRTHKDIKGLNMADSIQQDNPAIQSIILEIQKMSIEQSGLYAKYTQAHPEVIRINKQLAAQRSSLQYTMQSSLRTLKKRKQSLNNIIKKNKVKMQAFPEQEQKLAQLTRSFMVNEKIYSFLLEKRAEIAIIESSTVSEILIVEPTTPTDVEDVPIKPKRLLIIIFGFFLGLILGTVQALIRVYLDNTIKSVEDIEKLTKIPIYGAIPFLHSKESFQPYYESIRVIRTNLEFSRNNGKSKLITVTSSISGEGKTSTISELGRIIAKSNKKVILLDLDMRRSTMHEKFVTSNKVGMSTLLSGKSSLEEVIQKTTDENLNIITSGAKPPNPSELIMSDKLEEIIKELMSKYDYVLLDSPPIGMVTDAMIIMRMSDITLFVFKANFSTKDFIKNINRFIGKEKINAGIILNGIPFGQNFGYGYGYGYSIEGKGENNYYS